MAIRVGESSALSDEQVPKIENFLLKNLKECKSEREKRQEEESIRDKC